jgi:hypothetical protein
MREAIGKPQILAASLLLVFVLQCLWLVNRSLHSGEIETREWYRITTGIRLWGRTSLLGVTESGDPHGPLGPAPPPRVRDNDGFDPDHSELWYLIPSAPLALFPGHPDSIPLEWWAALARAPFLVFGALLGASLWYVARRLYGNAGGFIALTLYCFSPGIIQTTATWYAEPEIGAVWAAFGAIFTGIAVAHTLYAPREVILWNWKRIALLGISITLAVGSQFSLWILVALALAFMLYLAPTRRGAAVVIWSAACVLGLALLFAAYGFRPVALLQGFRHAQWLGLTREAFTQWQALRRVFIQLGGSSPAMVLMLPISLVTYAAWRRARYFGNTAPLVVCVVCLLLAWASPHYPGLGFQIVVLPFLFVFVSGVFADLMQTRQRVLVLASVLGLLSAYALLNILRLLEASLPSPV